MVSMMQPILLPQSYRQSTYTLSGCTVGNIMEFAAFFLAAYVIGEFKIGNTIAKTVNENFITLEVIFSGLIAAIAWNLLTWWFGIPSSSSHTLIGGFLGAALMHAFVTDYNQIAATQPGLGFLIRSL